MKRAIKEIDARGLGCPQPVILAGKAVDAGETRFAVLVDDEGAAENVRRYAEGKGFSVTLERREGHLRLDISKSGGAALRENASPATGGAPPARGKVILITTDSFGRGSEELGRVLVISLLNTLAESQIPPDKIILFNGGVKLACEDEDTVAALRKAAGRGVDVMACGTCLGYFQLKDRQRAGRVSNALEIYEAMMSGDVVTWS